MKEAITVIKKEIDALHKRQIKIQNSLEGRDEYDEINFKVERLERAIRCIRAIEELGAALR